jgi:branched-chain amino acid transport system permease protein
MAQVAIGLVNGAFYAMLSLGLSVIFGMLNVINFAHGAQYMMGAFAAWLMLGYLNVPFWASLVLAPVIVGLFGVVLERVLLKRLYHLDHLYGFLLTFGLSLVIEGLFRWQWGSSGAPYPAPISGATDLGFMMMPTYRLFIVVAALVVCLATWYAIERTRLGAYLRAATENPSLVRAFGINVPRLITITYGVGVGLAALAGVLAAPIQQVSALMGTNLVLVVFAVVVIGGMGSILGSVVTGFGLGLIEGLTKLYYPPASNTVIFVVMAIVLLVKPAGLFGQTK